MKSSLLQHRDALKGLSCHGSGWVLLSAFCLSICYLFAHHADTSSFILSILGAVTGHAALMGHDNDKSDKLSCRLAWVTLFLGGFLVYWNMPDGLVLSICLCGCVCWLSGWRLALRCLGPLLLMLVLAWHQEYLFMTMSLPMSRICAAFAGWLLQAFGVKVVVERATLLVGAKLVAVTAACSGVELFEASLLLCWFVVRRHALPVWMRVAHYMMLFPFVIVCNTLRLVGGILLYLRIGDAAFMEPWHSLFGYMVLVAVILLMLFTGWLLRGEEDGNAEE